MKAKYAFDLDDILSLFASNIKDGVLSEADLRVLGHDKVAKVPALSRVC